MEIKLYLDPNSGQYTRFDFGTFGVAAIPTPGSSPELVAAVEEEYFSFKQEESSIDGIFLKSQIDDDLAKIIEEAGKRLEQDPKNQDAIDTIGTWLSQHFPEILNASERYIPKRQYADAQERLHGFMQIVEQDHGMYSGETVMDSDRVGRYCSQLDGLKKEFAALASSLTEKELTTMLDTAEEVYPLNFYTGAGYGTCYGAPQLLTIIKNVKSQKDSLGAEEVHIAYIEGLGKLFKTRASFPTIPLEGELIRPNQQGFPYGTISYLNEQLKSAKSDEKLQLIQNIVQHSIEHKRNSIAKR